MKFIYTSVLTATLFCTAQSVCAFPQQETTDVDAMSVMAEESFKKMDLDLDGQVSKEEFLKTHPGMKEQAFESIAGKEQTTLTIDSWKKFMKGHGAPSGKKQSMADRPCATESGMPMVMPPKAGEGAGCTPPASK